MIRVLSPAMAVAPQIAAGDIPAIAAAGYRTIVNNRPDGEDPAQPAGEAIRAAAAAAGLAYHAIPVGHGGFDADQVDRTVAVLADAPGPVFAYCRSGTRSCCLWALAEARRGTAPDALAAAAAQAGYDLGAIRPLLDTLARTR